MEKPASPVYAVHLETAQAGHLAVTREYVGVIEPVVRSTAAFRVEGHIVLAQKDAGDPVEEGESIAAIDNRPLKRRIEAIEADLAGVKSDRGHAEKQLERRRPLLERGLIDPETLDAAESAYETAKSRVDSLRARLTSARIDMACTTIEAALTPVHAAVRDMPGFKMSSTTLGSEPAVISFGSENTAQEGAMTIHFVNRFEREDSIWDI